MTVTKNLYFKTTITIASVFVLVVVFFLVKPFYAEAGHEQFTVCPNPGPGSTTTEVIVNSQQADTPTSEPPFASYSHTGAPGQYRVEIYSPTGLPETAPAGSPQYFREYGWTNWKADTIGNRFDIGRIDGGNVLMLKNNTPIFSNTPDGLRVSNYDVRIGEYTYINPPYYDAFAPPYIVEPYKFAADLARGYSTSVSLQLGEELNFIVDSVKNKGSQGDFKFNAGFVHIRICQPPTTLTVNKVVVPNTDEGRFNLQINGLNAGTGANVGDGGTTGAVPLSSIGTYIVGETAVAPANLDDYEIAYSGDCIDNADGTGTASVTLNAGDQKTCTITNTKKGTVQIFKTTTYTGNQSLIYDGINNLFSYQIFPISSSIGEDGTYIITSGTSSNGSGSTGTNPSGPLPKLKPGIYNITEIVSSFNWAVTYLYCTPGYIFINQFVITAGQTATCTYTNNFNLLYGTIPVTKIAPAGTTGNFSFRAYSNAGANLGGCTIFNYPSSTQCNINNVTLWTGGTGTVYSVTEDNPGSNWGTPTYTGCSGTMPTSGTGTAPTCTVTNTPYTPPAGTGTITIIQDYPGDPTDFSFNGSPNLPRQCSISPSYTSCMDADYADPTLPNTTKWLNLIPDFYFLEQNPVAGALLLDMECTGNCQGVRYGRDGVFANPFFTPGDRGFSVPLIAAQDLIMRYVNELNVNTARLTINKVLVPDTDNGLFDLFINNVKHATEVGDNGTTGPVIVGTGNNTFDEIAAGINTDLSNYTTVVSGAGCGGTATAGTITLAAGENKTCTITNTKKGTIKIVKNTTGGNAIFNYNVYGGPTLLTPSINTNLTNFYGPASVGAGTYNITEILQNNWTLVSAFCTRGPNNTPTGIPSTNGVIVVTVGPGELTTCTFNNAAYTLSVKSTGVLGVLINSSGGSNAWGGTTNYTRTNFTAGQLISLGAPATSGGMVFLNWTGCDSENTVTCSVTMNTNKTVIANYIVSNPGNATIVVGKYMNGGAASFGFTGNVSGTISISGQILSASVPAGTYTSTETPLTGWTLNSIICNNPTSTGNLSTRTATFNITAAQASAGQSVICNFTNTATNSGSIKVNKKNNGPSGVSTPFVFTSNIPNWSTFSIIVGGGQTISMNIPDLPINNTYTIKEQVPPGWTATGSPSLPCTVTISPPYNLNRVCSFTNTPISSSSTGQIRIVKKATGGVGNETFNFTSNFGLSSLTTSGSSTSATAQWTSDALVAGSNYSISETSLPNWTLNSATCTNGTIQAINVVAGQITTCTFDNTESTTTAPQGTLEIIKEAPGGDNIFNYNIVSIPSLPSVLSVNTANSTSDTINLDAGDYDIEEIVPNGWQFNFVSCTYIIGTDLTNQQLITTTSLTNPIKDIPITAGETTTCTFYNSLSTTPPPPPPPPPAQQRTNTFGDIPTPATGIIPR